ncbi:OsmC family protein [Bdellovibrio svalbardensis]|uniref:OsmC family protein n=1 Tax=Bdellovibrio svalbardensis TaxID=2972972 RepID=A0ABT6DED5_9BACT|nr:OsmC family protein [Bdellovibrio svalbardensis]MDG0815201.1 OsmC family protein [Bdellovibrio svalbardensis]
MITYPLKFSVKASGTAGINANWQTSSHSMDQVLPAAVPPEFAGPGHGFSPEDFYSLAMANCYIATFKVFAERSHLDYKEIQADLTLEVDRDEKGFPWMARAEMQVRLYGPSSKEKAQALLDKTLKGCLVMNSIKTEKNVTFEIID